MLSSLVEKECLRKSQAHEKLLVSGFMFLGERETS